MSVSDIILKTEELVFLFENIGRISAKSPSYLATTVQNSARRASKLKQKCQHGSIEKPQSSYTCFSRCNKLLSDW